MYKKKSVTRSCISKRLLAALLCICMMVLSMPAAVSAETGKYYIKVNKGTNVVTVYTQDNKPYTAFICSVGSATPLGTYSTPEKYRWKTLDGPSYGQYCTRITAGFLFHSVWYYQQNLTSQSYVQYNRLGSTASHGCVRLTVASAKWIYDNCPLGTKVTIFSGSSADDPLGKPASIHVNANTSRGWDPTDPDPGNPYSTGNSKPSIKADSVINLQLKSDFKLSDYVKAYDSAGNALSSAWLRASGSVNTKQEGTQTVTYYLTDSFGRDASKTVTYKIGDTEKPKITGVQPEVTREYNASYKLRSKVRAKTKSGTNLTDRIVVQVKKPGENEYTKTRQDTLKLDSAGKYRVQYSVTNPSNKLEATETMVINVVDSKKPVLSSEDSFAKITLKSTETSITYKKLMAGVHATLRSGQPMDSKVSIKITDPEGTTSVVNQNAAYELNGPGKYVVLYQCANANKSLKTGQYMVAKKKRALIVAAARVTKIKDVLNVPEDTVLAQNQPIDLLDGVSVKETIKYSDKTKATEVITDDILIQQVTYLADGAETEEDIEVTDPAAAVFTAAGVYHITYSYTNEKGKQTTAVRTLTVSEAQAEESAQTAEAANTEQPAA